MTTGLEERIIAAFARTDGSLADGRRVARRFADADADTVGALLWSDDRGARLVGVVLLVNGNTAASIDAAADTYLAALRSGRLDDAELVDAGVRVLTGDDHGAGAIGDGALFALAKSDVVWARRAALSAALAWVRRGHADTALALAGRLVRERNPAIQEAVGVVVREAEKRGAAGAVSAFLGAHGSAMGPITRTLAIQHLPATVREQFRGRSPA